MDRLSIFENEFNLISDNKLREFAKYLILNADEYFFHIPASTSGKYHPTFDLGEGGLIRHSKVVVFMANSLAISNGLNKQNTDIVIISALVHDIKKLGDNGSEHTVKDHPLIAAKWIKEMAENFFGDLIPIDTINIICGCVLTHMGQWSNWRPITNLQKIVHSADYIASRKNITGFDFNYA